MTWRSRSQTPRRWEDQPWTRGEQMRFEEKLDATLGRLIDEVQKGRRQLSRLLGGIALLAVLLPIVIAAWALLPGGH